MKKKKSKKIQTKSHIKKQELGQTKNSAKLILFFALSKANLIQNL